MTCDLQNVTALVMQKKEIWKGMNSSHCHLHKTIKASCCSTFQAKRLP